MSQYESVGIPLDQPVIRIPLYDFVARPDTGEALDIAPEAMVEQFLNTRSEDFAAVEDAWSSVLAAQSNLGSAYTQVLEAAGANVPQPRDLQRRRTVIFNKILTPATDLGMCRQHAQATYTELSTSIAPGDPTNSDNRAIITQLLDFWEGRKEAAAEAQKSVASIGEFAQAAIKGHVEAQHVAVVAYVYAQFRQDVALHNIRVFLADDTVAPAFLARVEELARTGDTAAYPGLLELLATHVRQDAQQNMLLAALKRTAAEASAFAADFLRDFDARHGRSARELAAAISVLDIAAGIAERNLAIDKQRFIKLFAGETALWPSLLSDRLQAYAEARTAERWTGLQEALAPYIQTGRLVTNTTQRKAAVRVPVGPAPARGKRGGKKRPHSVVNMSYEGPVMPPATGGNYEDVMSACESESAARLGVLALNGSGNSSNFLVEFVPDLETLYLRSNLGAYVKKYQSDSTLRPAIDAAIRHILRQPTSRSYTRRLGAVQYTVGNRQRSPLRFSLQHFPGVPTGIIATQTRLIYDFFSHEGAPTLAMYGAFIKQDIEELNRLPRRQS